MLILTLTKSLICFDILSITSLHISTITNYRDIINYLGSLHTSRFLSIMDQSAAESFLYHSKTHIELHPFIDYLMAQCHRTEPQMSTELSRKIAEEFGLDLN
jgi:hypothetical protein